MIKLKHISKTFTSGGNQFKAVDDINIEIEKGDIVGIVGTSGAGKSTLVRCINLLERPDNGGEVIVDGEDLMKLTKQELQNRRKSIGMIFQHFNLMSQRTVLKNISFPLEHRGISKEDINKKTFELLELVGLSDKANSYPAQLSGGQKQRVAIARALAGDPKILLCDEATSALDPETTKSILKLLKEINSKLGLCIVIITHQKEVVKEVCKRIFVIEKGKLVEDGKTLEVFTLPKTDASKSFVGNILEDEHVIETLDLIRKNESKDTKVFKLTFVGDNSSEPFIAEVSKKFDVFLSILFGYIDIIQSETIGVLVVKAKGNEESIENVKKYLRENNILIEEVL